jgi:hypothetical protein
MMTATAVIVPATTVNTTGRILHNLLRMTVIGTVVDEAVLTPFRLAANAAPEMFWGCGCQTSLRYPQNFWAENGTPQRWLGFSRCLAFPARVSLVCHLHRHDTPSCWHSFRLPSLRGRTLTSKQSRPL